MEETGCKIICGAPTTVAVKGYMTMMIFFNFSSPSLTLWMKPVLRTHDRVNTADVKIEVLSDENSELAIKDSVFLILE